MEANCPTINTIKSHLGVDLPKAREIHGILSGIVTVRKYKAVQETIDKLEVRNITPLKHFLQLIALVEALGITDATGCVLSLGDGVECTLELPAPYRYSVKHNKENKFVFTNPKNQN